MGRYTLAKLCTDEPTFVGWKQSYMKVPPHRCLKLAGGLLSSRPLLNPEAQNLLLSPRHPFALLIL